MAKVSLGRVQGSMIYTGNANTNEEITTLLASQNIVALDGDLFLNESNLNFFKFSKSQNLWNKIVEMNFDTSIIGTGELSTDAKNLIGAVNELNAKSEQTNTNVSDLNNTVQELSNDVTELQSTTQGFTNSISGLGTTTQNLSNSVNDLNSDKQDKKQVVTTLTSNTVELADNTEYIFENVETLIVTYPEGDFESWLKISLKDSENLSIQFPNDKYIGEAPSFASGETWEISIKNGVMIAGKVETNG